MEDKPLEEVVRNIDKRLGLVEQFLPTLATKVEHQEAIAEAVAPLATKIELREALAEEGERTRRYFDVVAERLEGHVRLIADGHMALREQIVDLRTELKGDIAQHDRRITRLEARRKP